ncbi:hypothetical protein [Comamonas sp.]|uniref:hypothetical protein n=1 Tax=Comamonas sp. TaxID=34028 RepID=UPI00264939B1|nr:hypothetical protein [Comamonas sp.]
MSAPMYFNPHPEQIAESKASTCALATPKDPRDCEHSTCCHKQAGQRENVQCHNFRPGKGDK